MSGQNDLDRFLTCLYNLTRHDYGFPPLADDYIPRVAFCVAQVNGVYKVPFPAWVFTEQRYAVEILAAGAQRRPSIFQDLKSVGLHTIFGHRDPYVQVSINLILVDLLCG